MREESTYQELAGPSWLSQCFGVVNVQGRLMFEVPQRMLFAGILDVSPYRDILRPAGLKYIPI